MKIWHVGASSSPYRVDGVSRTVWSLSRQQSRLGNDVTLLIDTPPEPAAIQLGNETGLRLIEVQASAMTYRKQVRAILEREKPDIVHMHSVFVVRQAALGMVLRKLGVPYVITPHAGLAPQVLKRGVIKKTIYSMLRERPRFMGASAIGLVTPNEERAVRAFLPNYKKTIRWMPNPIDIDQFDPNEWLGVQPEKHIIFMGRFDVLVKGIDVLVEIARLLPEAQFDLYGTEDPRTLDWLNRLKADLPANVKFHAPIFGADKARMLTGASLYLQPSRWEGFPVSVAECLYMGLPCAIADTLDMAQIFRQHDLGLVVPLEPVKASQALREAMADHDRLRAWSAGGKVFSREHFHPEACAKNYLSLYEEVLQTDRGGVNGNLSTSPTRARGPRLVPVHFRSAIKARVSGALHLARQALGKNGVPRTVVLCYHSINQSDSDLAVAPATFREQLRVLKEQGYVFMDFRGLLGHVIKNGAPRGNVACVTFDDGYEDNLTQAAPILTEMKIPATMFVTSGLMTGDPAVVDRFRRLTGYETPYLSASQARELSSLGFEIGSHTHSHPNLALLDARQTWDEVMRSRKTLEDAIGGAVSTFAYPFGKRGIHYTGSTVRALRESGLQGAAAVAFCAVNARASVRIYEIPRFFVNRSDTTDSFAQKVRGDYDWLGALQRSTPSWIKGLVSPEDRYL